MPMVPLSDTKRVGVLDTGTSFGRGPEAPRRMAWWRSAMHAHEKKHAPGNNQIGLTYRIIGVLDTGMCLISVTNLTASMVPYHPFYLLHTMLSSLL